MKRIAVLAGLAVSGGWVGASLFGIHGIAHFLDPVLGEAQQAAVALRDFAGSHAAEWGAAGASVAVFLLGLGLAWYLYLKNPELPGRIAAGARGLYQLVLNKYWIDEIYDALIVKPIYWFSVGLWRVIDDLVIDGWGVNGPARVLRGIGGIGRRLQSGDVQAYAFWLFAGLAGVLLYLALVMDVL